jgi:hypothetical protein
MILFLQETLQKMTWGAENAVLILILAILLWLLASRLKILRMPLVQPIIFGLFVAAVGYLLIGDAFAWVVLFLLFGIGFSLRTLMFDLIAGVLIRLEHRVIMNAWIDGDGFSGRVQDRFWRCVILTDIWGRSIVVPNRVFVQQSVVISKPGAYRTAIQCWIPEKRKLIEAEQMIVGWLDDSPWVSRLFSIYPDTTNPRVLIVEVSLLRAEDKNKVLRALRTIIEKE